MILITGGTGYIGSHICKKFNDDKINYFSIDNCSRSHFKNVIKKKNFIKCDISSKKILEILKRKKIKTVIHSAAYTFPNESELKKKIYFINNIKKTIKFIDYCKKSKVENFIFLSSSNVYRFNSRNNKVLKPENYYGFTKLYIERYLKKKVFFNTIILRLFNIAGFIKNFDFIEYKSKFRRIMPKISSAIKDNKIIEIYGKKKGKKFQTSIRDYLYIEDLLNLIKIILKNKIKNKKFDVGSGSPISLYKIIKIFEKKSKKKLRYIFKKRRKGELQYTCSKKNSINLKDWKPKKNIYRIIESTLIWDRHKT